MQIYKVFDNNGKTIDRYTILFEPWHFGKSCNALTVSNNPEHPQRGVSNWGEVYELSDTLGKEIEFEDLPKKVRNHVLWRIQEQEI